MVSLPDYRFAAVDGVARNLSLALFSVREVSGTLLVTISGKISITNPLKALSTRQKMTGDEAGSWGLGIGMAKIEPRWQFDTDRRSATEFRIDGHAAFQG
jgi:hypothetical protein